MAGVMHEFIIWFTVELAGNMDGRVDYPVSPGCG